MSICQIENGSIIMYDDRDRDHPVVESSDRVYLY